MVLVCSRRVHGSLDILIQGPKQASVGGEACITSILPACSSKDMIYCYVARCSKEALILITGVG